MAAAIESFTLGVEEEYQIVDASTRALVGRESRLLPVAAATLGDAVQPELQSSMIEIATPVCKTLADVRRELSRARRGVIDAAVENGSRIAAAGTHPFSAWSDQRITNKERYKKIAADFGTIANETVIFGCHVHVGIENRDVAIDVLNRVRAQLFPLLALSANSPFWLGEDTSYASFRTEVWSRWPLSGPPLAFASTAEYDELIEHFIAAGVIEDETKLYWDLRPSGRFPTLEFRIADVCSSIDEAVMIAGLARALTRQAYLAAKRDEPFVPIRHELIRAAHWQAARFGIDGELIDVRTGARVAARELIEGWLGGLREALEEAGDYDEVCTLVRATFAQGTGSVRQRAVFAQTNDLRAVVGDVIARTEAGT
jgi:carboxylate-amine ligase